MRKRGHRMPALGENQRFERYRITRYLGRGISGESYEAEDTVLQRKVTLKLIHPWSMLADAARRQFFREMQRISMLNHPYLATVLDYGETNSRLYVVRRYATSGSLLSSEGRMWFQPPLSITDAIHYGHQLAQSLEYIHRCGCLHGALTLSNILVLRGANSDNEPDFAPFLLADVGLANFVRRFGQSPLSLLPITAAPEQLGKRVTSASDQFALAVLLYFWLAGRPPYLGSPEEIEHLKLTETIPPISSLNSGITFEQEIILQRALAVYPEERYPSMRDFADALLATLLSPSSETPLSKLTIQPEPALDVETQANLASEETPLLNNQTDLQELPLLTDQSKLEQPASETLASIEPSLEANNAQQPLPQPSPEPLPVPAPEPLPQPGPEPLPVPAPEPLPQPGPEPLPQPAPDIYQPLPQPATEPTVIPQTGTPSGESDSSEAQKVLEIQATQPILSPQLIMSFSGGEPHEYMLEREETTLGRAGSDDILLDQDTSISRHHALLRYEEDNYVIYDQRSASGVFVNGQKLAGDTGYTLVDGDAINIGSYILIFRDSNLGASQKVDEISPDAAAIDSTKVGVSS